MSSKQLKEHLEQLAPKLVEPITPKDYSDVQLTPEEESEALYKAKKAKAEREEQDRYNREYWEKVTTKKTQRNFTAEELRKAVLLSRTATGDRFVIDDDNKAQVNALCLYFAGDARLEKYGFSHDKGLFLMGPKGVGKSHLMSLFFQNQKASYVMAPCRRIEDTWNNAKPEDLNVIKYYSRPIDAAVNSNPFGAEQLGVCFDDLGTETVPSKRFGEEKNVMAEILLARYDYRFHAMQNNLPYVPTHITTNITGPQLIALYGDRLNDRLKEMCNVIVFPNEAKSRRK